MKKIILSSFIILGALTSMAQEKWCATMSNMEEFHQENPEAKEAYLQQLQDFNKYVSKLQGNKAASAYTLPVVVHVVHYNGAGNISKAQIENGLSIINTDFNKLNGDTVSVRSVFKPHISNMDIEFKLATKDPLGNCTEGITRQSHYYSKNRRNEPKALIGWDPFSYLNVWIVNSINPSGLGSGTILGFAQFPSPNAGASNTYGLVVRADEWGSIEAAQGNDGRTVTHEIGHCLELLHTFQGGCGSFCQATGDFVCDTPPQFDDNNNSCSPSLNTCTNDASGNGGSSNSNPYNSNVPDQLENYMGYGLNCLGMFTEGQKTRVHSALTSYQKLIQTSSASNLISTGTNAGHTPGVCVPIAETWDFDKFLCAGGSTTFNQSSYGGPLTSYSWSFPGGTPSSSNSSTPTITYNNPGNYNVVLRVANSAGSDSIVLSNYVHVSSNAATYSGFNYVESFESASGFSSDWVLIDRSSSTISNWDRASFAGSAGSSSLWINNLNCAARGEVDQAISPSIKMSDVLNPSISMKVAYKRKNSGSNDEIKLFASTDCGASWVNIINMLPTFYAYDNSTNTNNFIPTQTAHWRTVSIPAQFIPSSIKTADNVKFMLELENGNGNNVFIDEFKINGQLVGIEDQVVEESDFVIYPNPSNGWVNLDFNIKQNINSAKLFVQDVIGKTYPAIYQGSLSAGPYQFKLNGDELASGVYIVRLELDGEILSRKLVIK